MREVTALYAHALASSICVCFWDNLQCFCLLLFFFPNEQGPSTARTPEELHLLIDHALQCQEALLAVQGMRSLDVQELDALTRSLEGVAPDLTLVHRLRHSLAMQQNDLTTAVEALQRYFDYSHGLPLPLLPPLL